ncbi:MAG: sugar phosphate isomerase/epimerase [Planctomycetes bacterium]|nr:sugar phosphate isomerase/epimerase [Planctomycetota bacterium]
MRIGIQQTAFGETSLEESLSRARLAGAEGLGLCYRTQEEALALEDPRYILKTRSLFERFELSITGLHLGVLCLDQSLIGPAPVVSRSVNLIEKALTAAAQLGKPDVIVPFFGKNRIELPKEFDTAGMAFSTVAQAAEDLGVTLAIESSLHLGQLQQFLAGCGSDFVKVCLDTGDVTACRHDPVSMISGLGLSGIAQVHFRDVRLASRTPPDFNVRMGRGNVDFRGVAGMLHALGYDGWVVLETPPGDDDGQIVSLHVDDARNLLAQGRDREPSDDHAVEHASS